MYPLCGGSYTNLYMCCNLYNCSLKEKTSQFYHLTIQRKIIFKMLNFILVYESLYVTVFLFCILFGFGFSPPSLSLLWCSYVSSIVLYTGEPF